MKALVGAFNQEKALVGAFSVILKTGCGTDGALHSTTDHQKNTKLTTTGVYAAGSGWGWWPCPGRLTTNVASEAAAAPHCRPQQHGTLALLHNNTDTTQSKPGNNCNFNISYLYKTWFNIEVYQAI